VRRPVGDAHVGVALLAFCLAMALAIPGQIHEPQVAIAGWGKGALSAAFFPYAVISALAVATIALLATRRQRPEPLPLNDLDRTAVGRLAGLLGLLVVYVAALDWLGYLLATALLLASVMTFLGYRRWGVMAAVAVATPGVTFWAFERLLKVFLPRGVLFP